MTNFETILIDDNEVDLFLHEKLIRHHGLSDQIVPFKEASEALDYLRYMATQEKEFSKQFVLILDIKMPDMDGFMFLERFEKLPAAFRERCRVVMLSASLHAGDLHRARAHHLVDAILKKPLTIKELSGLLKS